MRFIAILIILMVAVLTGQKENVSYRCSQIARRAERLGVEVFLETGMKQQISR